MKNTNSEAVWLPGRENQRAGNHRRQGRAGLDWGNTTDRNTPQDRTGHNQHTRQRETGNRKPEAENEIEN